MNNKEEKKEFIGWWFLILGLIIVSVIILAILNYAGLFGRTVFERKIFENSFQYSEARKTEIETFRAELLEIENRLSDINLDSDTRETLNVRASALRIKIKIAQKR